MKLERREIVEIVGITAVVVSLIFVGYELQQTQKSMLAESSTVRAQMAIDQAMNNPGMGALFAKIENGDAIAVEDIDSARTWATTFLRYVENLHYQWELGLLDEEIWEANQYGLNGLLNSPFFPLTHPDFFAGQAGTFRASFVDLARSLSEVQ